jgi:uncharacterized protein YecT (DUF1311 family)
MRAALAVALIVALAAPALAQNGKPDAKASEKIQDCVKTKSADGTGELCIGIVATPCLERDDTKSTADMTNCVAVETRVWDDILNETFRRLKEKLDDTQQTKLREMQRAWVTSRDKTCDFYWDFYQGTMATPMSADCVNRETAQRALFLLGFLNETDKK